MKVGDGSHLSGSAAAGRCVSVITVSVGEQRQTLHIERAFVGNQSGGSGTVPMERERDIEREREEKERGERERRKREGSERLRGHKKTL